MKIRFKFALKLLIAFGFSNFVNAQNTLDNIGLTSSTPASVAFSLRQLSTVYTGPLVRIKVGTSFYDVYPDSITKNFSLSSKISAPIGTYNATVSAASGNSLSTIITAGTTNATVAIWYDQSGNSIHVLSSSSTATIIRAGTINTLYGQPTVYFSGSSGESLLTSSNTVNYSAQSGATVNVVAQNVSTTTSVGGIIGTANGIQYPGYNISYGTNGLGYQSDGAGCQPATSLISTNPQIVTNIFLNSTTNLSNTYINGVLKTNSGGTCSLTNTSGSKIYIGSARGYGSFSFIGNISEAIIFPKQLVDAERNPLESNQSSAYFSPFVTITSSALGTVCAGTNITFTANAYNFNTPSYQWYANGTVITSATSSTYSSTSLTNGVQVNVKVNEGPLGEITSNGLLLNLDAANPASYSGSGNTWTNLVTGNAVPSFSITSGTYVNSNGGVIRFPSTGGFAESTTGFVNLTGFTVEVWVKMAGTKGDYDPVTGSNYAPCLFSEKVSGGTVNMVLAYNSRAWSGAVNNSYRYTAAMGGWETFEPITNYGSDLNNWVQIVATYNGSVLTLYRNGVSLGSSTTNINLRATSLGYYIAHRWDMSDGVYGDYSKVMMYNKALSISEVTANNNAFNARFTGSGVNSSSITTSVNSLLVTPIITVAGDACVNKTSLTTPTGLTSYVWYKDNVAISNAITNSYVPTIAGDYKVLVSNGTCATYSAVSTIYTCAVTADGSMSPLTSSTTLVSNEGGKNFGTGINELGSILNTTSLTTTTGAIGATTVILGGVIAATNAITLSIGVIYSNDINFATFTTHTIQSNVASGTYTSTISGLSPLTAYHAKSFIVNKAGTSYGPVVSFTTASPPVVVGDVYGGGAVFYILKSGDPGYDANVQHGLILAPIGLGFMNWNTDNRATGATGTALGTGVSNTNAIIASQGGALTNSAAGKARAYNGGGYTDWYLGSLEEIRKLNSVWMVNALPVEYRYSVHPYAYWTSTESSTNNAQAYRKNIGSNDQYTETKNSQSWSVTAIRSF
jgi:hypothetical protein